MGSLRFHTQLWETLKKINTISWTPDNPLAGGVKSRQEITKPTKFTSPHVHTGVLGEKRTTAANCFLPSFRVCHIKLWGFSPPIKTPPTHLCFGEPKAFSPCYSTPTPTFDISQVRRGSRTHRRRMRLMSYLLIQNVSAKKIFHPELLTRGGSIFYRELSQSF